MANPQEDIPNNILASALVSLPERLSRSSYEREILRVVSNVTSDYKEDILATARQEVLKWALRRAGGELPDEAWQGSAFEMLAAGRITMGASVETETGLIWSLRGDDPDKSVPGRIWSTEVSLGRLNDATDVLLGVRLLVNSTEAQIDIEPSVPGLVLQLADKLKLRDGPLSARPFVRPAETEENVETLVDWFRSEGRRLPIIVASGDERSEFPDRPIIDADILAKALCGLAHVVSLPARLTYKLSDLVGKRLSVFHGGVRIYQPGFEDSGDTRDHTLYLGSAAAVIPSDINREIRVRISRESLRRTRIGHDVLPFASVRSAASQLREERQIAEGASDTEQLEAAHARNRALEQEIKGLRAEVDQTFELSVQEANRAEDAEKQLASAWGRIEHLEAAFSESPAHLDDSEPASWEDFAEWCDGCFAGRLSLAPGARREVRKPAFQDFGLAARSVRWLATEARERFLHGGGTLSNVSIFEGVTNSPCGADEYHFDFQGRRLLANWHIKNGGNTRQPERCLRIYYSFDEVSRQIIISDMPAHRHTDAT